MNSEQILNELDRRYLVLYTAKKRTQCDIEEEQFERQITELNLSRCVKWQ